MTTTSSGSIKSDEKRSVEKRRVAMLEEGDNIAVRLRRTMEEWEGKGKTAASTTTLSAKVQQQQRPEEEDTTTSTTNADEDEEDIVMKAVQERIRMARQDDANTAPPNSRQQQETSRPGAYSGAPGASFRHQSCVNFALVGMPPLKEDQVDPPADLELANIVVEQTTTPEEYLVEASLVKPEPQKEDNTISVNVVEAQELTIHDVLQVKGVRCVLGSMICCFLMLLGGLVTALVVVLNGMSDSKDDDFYDEPIPESELVPMNGTGVGGAVDEFGAGDDPYPNDASDPYENSRTTAPAPEPEDASPAGVDPAIIGISVAAGLVALAMVIMVPAFLYYTKRQLQGEKERHARRYQTRKENLAKMAPID